MLLLTRVLLLLLLRAVLLLTRVLCCLMQGPLPDTDRAYVHSFVSFMHERVQSIAALPLIAGRLRNLKLMLPPVQLCALMCMLHRKPGTFPHLQHLGVFINAAYTVPRFDSYSYTCLWVAALMDACPAWVQHLAIYQRYDWAFDDGLTGTFLQLFQAATAKVKARAMPAAAAAAEAQEELFTRVHDPIERRRLDGFALTIHQLLADMPAAGPQQPALRIPALHSLSVSRGLAALFQAHPSLQQHIAALPGSFVAEQIDPLHGHTELVQLCQAVDAGAGHVCLVATCVIGDSPDASDAFKMCCPLSAAEAVEVAALGQHKITAMVFGLEKQQAGGSLISLGSFDDLGLWGCVHLEMYHDAHWLHHQALSQAASFSLWFHDGLQALPPFAADETKPIYDVELVLDRCATLSAGAIQQLARRGVRCLRLRVKALRVQPDALDTLLPLALACSQLEITLDAPLRHHQASCALQQLLGQVITHESAKVQALLLCAHNGAMHLRQLLTAALDARDALVTPLVQAVPESVGPPAALAVALVMAQEAMAVAREAMGPAVARSRAHGRLKVLGLGYVRQQALGPCVPVRHLAEWTSKVLDERLHSGRIYLYGDASDELQGVVRDPTWQQRYHTRGVGDSRMVNWAFSCPFRM